MEEGPARHAPIARRLVELFEHRFDPARADSSSLAAIGEVQAIDHALDAVESLDEDRILRSFLTLVLKSLRTNYYQTLPGGAPRPALAVKLASSAIDLPLLPRPPFEIYVYSPRQGGRVPARWRGGTAVRPQGGFPAPRSFRDEVQTVKRVSSCQSVPRAASS
jgi:NAD-specific glutamate dehydrogenase